MSLGTIQIPVLFDMLGNSIVFGEDGLTDFVTSHLDFALDMTTETNDISLNAADISSAILIGDQDTGDNIFYSGGASSNISVDNLCNRIAKAITRGKLVHLPKSGDHSNSGIPMGGRLELRRADGQVEVPPDGRYAAKYLTSIAPIGDEQKLGEAMARVAAIHLVGTPLAANILVDKNSVQSDLETATAETFNSGNTSFYNALAVQLSKVLGGSKSSAPMNNGITTSNSYDVFINSNQTEITASDAEGADEFGESVAIEGNLIVVGAWGNDDDGSKSGSAYIFNATNGNQLHKLTASDAAANHNFGKSVGISENNIIIGAPGGGTGGIAYIFNATTGAELRKLTRDDTAFSDNFGWAVAISGNYAIVGSTHDDDNHNNAGSAYIFNVTTGNQLQKLTCTDPAQGDEFGMSVAISGNNAIVGTKNKKSGSKTNVGAAYIFDVTNGNQLRKLTASDGNTNHNFGLSVGISDNYAIVGAHGNVAAYIFDITNGNELHKLTVAAGNFGRSVDISGNKALVGAKGDDDPTNSGSAFIFDAVNGTQLYKLTATDAQAEDHLGVSVAISDNYAIVGRKKDYNTNDTGSVYIFEQTTVTNYTHPLDASGTSVPALKSIYEQLMNVPGRSQIMPTRDISGVQDNSNVTLTGGFPFIAGDKLVMYLRPKIIFDAQTQAEQVNALQTFNYTNMIQPILPIYNISDKNGTIKTQTYSQSSSENNTDFIFEKATDGNGVTGGNYWTSAGNTYNNTTGIHNGVNANGETQNVDGSNTINGEWGQVDIGELTLVTELHLTTKNGYNDRSPREFRLLGSTDGTNWITIIHKTEAGPWADDTVVTFDIPNHKQFRYYRYVVIKCYNAVTAGNIDSRTSIGYFELKGVKYPSEIAENKELIPVSGSGVDIPGLATNVVATNANIQDVFPGNETPGTEAEVSKWGWMGSPNSDSLSLDSTDVTNVRTIDLHIWKITITL